MEDDQNKKGQAFFKLAERWKHLNIGHVLNSFMGGTEVDLDDEIQEDTPKLDQGDHWPKAHFGRCHTHNKQLVVCCCGVIAAHTTIFSTEAISGVKVSMNFHNLCGKDTDNSIGLSQVSLKLQT